MLLMQAAARGFDALAQDLIGRSADVNARDDRGESGLLKAVANFKPSLSIVQMLVEHGANQLDDSTDRALRSGAPEIAEYLLSLGGQAADPNLLLNAARNGWTGVVSHLLAGGADPNHRHPQCGRPLMWATKPEIIELLVAAGADPNAQAETGDTALTLACAKGEKWKVEALLQHGANANGRAYHQNFESARGLPVLKALDRLTRYPEIANLLRAAVHRN